MTTQVFAPNGNGVAPLETLAGYDYIDADKERRLLSCIIQDNAASFDACDKFGITAWSFGIADHSRIFNALRRDFDSGLPASTDSVIQWEPDLYGLASEIAWLAPSPIFAPRLAEEVSKLAATRQALRLMQDAAEHAVQGDVPGAKEILAQLNLPQGGREQFQFLTLAELLKLPQKQWLIDQVIGERDLGMLYGPPGSGKSFLVIDLIFSACLGQKWARRFDVSRPLSVALCAGEGLSGLSGRFDAACEFYGVTDLPGFHFSPTAPQLYARGTPDAIEWFVKDWERHKAGNLDLLVIDTLHAATVGMDENSAQDTGRVLAAMKDAARRLGCAVLVVHHANKAGSAERGSSALRGAMDTMLEARPTANKFVLECAKLKDGKAWKPQTFDLTEEGESARVWWDEPADAAQNGKMEQDREAILSAMRSAPSVKFTAKSLAELLGMSGTTHVYKLLKSLVSDGGVKRELMNPSQQSSNRNPWVFSLTDPS